MFCILRICLPAPEFDRTLPGIRREANSVVLLAEDRAWLPGLQVPIGSKTSNVGGRRSSAKPVGLHREWWKEGLWPTGLTGRNPSLQVIGRCLQKRKRAKVTLNNPLPLRCGFSPSHHFWKPLGTNGQFGVPLSILGATGPLAHTLVVYDLSEAMDLEFMPFYFWTYGVRSSASCWPGFHH